MGARCQITTEFEFPRNTLSLINVYTGLVLLFYIKQTLHRMIDHTDNVRLIKNDLVHHYRSNNAASG